MVYIKLTIVGPNLQIYTRCHVDRDAKRQLFAQYDIIKHF